MTRRRMKERLTSAVIETFVNFILKGVGVVGSRLFGLIQRYFAFLPTTA